MLEVGLHTVPADLNALGLQQFRLRLSVRVLLRAPQRGVTADDAVPGVDKLLVVFELAQDVGHVAWHHIKVFAHGLKRADSPCGHCRSELENVLSDAGEERRGWHGTGL